VAPANSCISTRLKSTLQTCKLFPQSHTQDTTTTRIATSTPTSSLDAETPHTNPTATTPLSLTDQPATNNNTWSSTPLHLLGQGVHDWEEQAHTVSPPPDQRDIRKRSEGASLGRQQHNPHRTATTTMAITQAPSSTAVLPWQTFNNYHITTTTIAFMLQTPHTHRLRQSYHIMLSISTTFCLLWD